MAKFSVEQKNNAVILLKEGVSPKLVAQRTGVSESVVGWLVTQYGLQRRQKIDAALKSQIIEDWNTGKTLAEISAQLNIKIGTIGAIVSKHGIRRKAIVTDEQRQKVISLRRSTSMTIKDIGLCVGVNPLTVEDILTKNAVRKLDVVTDEQRKTAVNMRASDASVTLKQIAATVGLKSSTVADILSKAGLRLSVSQLSDRIETDRRLRERRLTAIATKNGGRYMQGFVNSWTKCWWRCSSNHDFAMRPLNVVAGQWCSKCSYVDGASKPQREIFSFLSELLPTEQIEISNRQVIAPKELDIWLPARNLAIEYCGLWWHSEGKLGKRARRRHVDKLEACEKLGIRLVTVFSDEWQFKKEVVKNYLKAILGLKTKTIGARQTQVIIPTRTRAQDFFDIHHLQGAAGNRFYGLEDKSGQLVAVASFDVAKRSRRATTGSRMWELTRYCVRGGTNVPGGLSKLLKIFIRDYQPQSIVSYSDRRWSVGALYKAVGFRHDGRCPPNYTYFHRGGRGNRKGKSHYTKIKLMALGAKSWATEWEMAKSLGLDRIWDCGLDRWVYDVAYLYIDQPANHTS